MIKTFSLLKRRPEMTRAEFHRWWLEDHIPYAVKLPGVLKYRVCLTIGSTTHPDDEAPFDGVAELWFDDRAAMEHAWTVSEEGKRAIEDSYANVSERWVLITEEHVILG